MPNIALFSSVCILYIRTYIYLHTYIHTYIHIYIKRLIDYFSRWFVIVKSGQNVFNSQREKKEWKLVDLWDNCWLLISYLTIIISHSIEFLSHNYDIYLTSWHFTYSYDFSSSYLDFYLKFWLSFNHFYKIYNNFIIFFVKLRKRWTWWICKDWVVTGRWRWSWWWGEKTNSIEVIRCRCKCVAVLLLARNNQLKKTSEFMSSDALIDRQTLTAENIEWACVKEEITGWRQKLKAQACNEYTSWLNFLPEFYMFALCFMQKIKY